MDLVKKESDLENFVRTYVDVAVSCAGCYLDKFDERVREGVSETFGIPREQVAQLHHPFHWAFFSPGGEHSPFNLSSVKVKDDKGNPQSRFFVGLKQSFVLQYFSIGDYILKNYGDYLTAKFNNLNQ